MSKTSTHNPRKVSALSEFSALSAGIIIAIIVFSIFAVTFYVYMMRPPEKTYAIEDSADLLTDDDETRLKNMAGELSGKKQMNVIIITTADKGYSYENSDEGSEQFAADKYWELSGAKSFKDNSGVLMMIDMQNRYVYIYTYASAHAAISDDECEEMAYSVVGLLKDMRYGDALASLMNQIYSTSAVGGTLVFIYLLYILGPIGLTSLIIFLVTRHRRSKLTTDYSTYIDTGNCRDTGDEDKFTHKTTSVTTRSSGGGGHSGGGGGGGGHSGGGGAHF